jgi:hypothetical protein
METPHESPPLHVCECATRRQHPGCRTAADHRALNRIVAGIDERYRRLLVGLLAHQQGRGGVALRARITGLSPHTIRRGRCELHQPDRIPPGRVRRPGGGRKRGETTAPGSGRPWRTC